MLEALRVGRTAEHACCDDAVPIALTRRATGTLDRRGAPCFRATRIMTMKRRNLTTVLPVLCIACGARSDLYLQAPPRDGNVLWSNELSCPNCTYSAGADPDGGLVVLTPDIEGLDAKTGTVLWSGIEPLQDGSTFYFGSMMVLGPPGVVCGATYGGVVFSASDG